MTEHAVVIAGGGPTGLMLAAELTLAGIDVVVVERRATQDLDGSRRRRSARPHDRGARSARRRRAVPRRRASRIPPWATPYIPLDISDFPTRHNYVLALWQRDIERILAGWVDELGVPMLRSREVVGLHAGRRGRRRRAVRWHDRCERPTSSGATAGAAWCARPPASSSRAGTPRPAGSSPRSRWTRSPRSARAARAAASARSTGPRAAGPTGRAAGAGGRARQRADAGRPPRGARRRVRHRLRRAQPDVDLPLHRHVAPGGVLSRRPRAARRRRRARAPPAGRAGPQRRRAGRGEPRLEARAGGRGDLARRACSTPTTTSAIRSGPGCCTTPWRRSRSTTPDDRHQALRETMAELLAMDEPRRRTAGDDLRPRHPLRPRRGPPAARAPHARPRPRDRGRARRGSSPCCTTPGPCCSTSASPAASTSRPGPIASGWSTPTYDGVWELPVIGEVDAPAAVLIRPDGHVAWTGALTDPDLPSALTTWFGAPAPPTGGAQSSRRRAAMKTSPGTSTRPIVFIFFLPSFCFSSSLRLRVMSPP